LYKFKAVQIFPDGIYQFPSRTAVKIAHQTNVQIIKRSVDANFKILCHFCLSAKSIQLSFHLILAHLEQ
jgi:hypothetical protein